MSIFQKIGAYLKKPAASNNASTAAPPQGLSPLEDPKPVDHVINIYSHGFTNGVYRIELERDTFEHFLHADNELEKIKELRMQNEALLSAARERLKTEQASIELAERALLEKEKPLEFTRLQIATEEQWRSAFLERKNELSAQQQETKPEYAWVPALFYLLAGIVFIIGDIAITHQITSWGFDMKGRESWAFAVGLAFTAFLIKPLIDRLLEKPFQKAGLQLHKIYKIALVLITILGISMLFLLGKFRSEAQSANTRLGMIRTQLNEMEDEKSTEYRALIKERKQINDDLTNNAVGEWGIILSGIIFAIGGGLCLSVAFPSLAQLVSRYWILPFRAAAYGRRVKKCDRKIFDLRGKAALLSAGHETAMQKLKAANVAEAFQKLEALEKEHKQLLILQYEAQYLKEKNLYHDGRNRGERYVLEGDLFFRVGESDPSALYNGKGKNGQEGLKPPPRSYTRRPFIKMRKMIADNYNKNQNTQAQDGTDFEIIS
jgi:hypothetical protein